MNSRNNSFSSSAELISSTEAKPFVEGLVISSMDYKDADAIVTVAMPNELVEILARGVQKETSKNRRLVMPFSRSHFNYEPKYSRDLLFLINGHVMDSWWKCAQSLEIQALSDLICRLIVQLGITPEIYEDLERFWQSAHEGKEADALLCACKALVELLRIAGVVMNVDECVVCGRQNRIASVSMMEGGFVCLDHCDLNPLWKKEDLLLLRRLVRFPIARLLEQPLRPTDYSLAIYLLDWYVYTTQSTLRSLSFLKKLRKERIEIGLPLHEG